MLHNFKSSLNHEREQTGKADRFYCEVLHATDIKRFNSDSEADMAMQRQDVDLLLTVNDTVFRVSEKFRDRDYGDLYVEVFSKYPHTPGWMHTGSPNAILYFTPETVYWITHKSLSAFCLDVLFPVIPEKWYEELFQSHKTIIPKQILFNKKFIRINLIQAHNKDGASWETIGVSAPFSFFEENAVKIKQYPAIT
jgi:hypothetical protein